MESKTKVQETFDKVTASLISKKGRNGLILGIAILVVSALSGLLGAFKNGEFQRTYDFVSVEQEYTKIDYNDPIFSDLSKNSRVETYRIEEYRTDENGEVYLETVLYYKGYYKNYFFTSGWFYSETGLNTVLIMIFYVALINYLIAKREDEDEVYKKLEEELNDLIVVRNDLPPSTFEPFIDKWNLERKIRQHISNIKYALSVLEKKTPFIVRKEFIKKENDKRWFEVPDRPLTKKESKYLRIKTELESLLDDSFIQENVEFSKVKYFRFIYPSFVYNGNNNLHKTTDEYSTVESNERVYSKDLIRKVMLGFSITLFFTSILSFSLIRTTDNWLVVFFNVFLKLLPLIIQWALAIDYVNTHMSRQRIPLLKYRLNIASIYLSRKHEVEKMVETPIKKIIEEKNILEDKEIKLELKVGEA